MKHLNRIKATAVIILGLSLNTPAISETEQNTSREQVEAKIAETVSLIEVYYGEQFDTMIAEAQLLLEKLDAAAAARQQEKREEWAQMTESAQESANAQLVEMQTALVEFAQQIGEFRAKADRAWNEVLSGLVVALKETADVLSARLGTLEDER